MTSLKIIIKQRLGHVLLNAPFWKYIQNDFETRFLIYIITCIILIMQHRILTIIVILYVTPINVFFPIETITPILLYIYQ